MHTRYHVLTEVHSIRGTPEHARLEQYRAELATITGRAQQAIIDAALSVHGPGPLPAPGRKARPAATDGTASLFDDMTEPGSDVAEAEADLQRLAQFAAVLPDWPPRWAKPLSGLVPGDVIGYRRPPGRPLHRDQPAAPPPRRHHRTRRNPGQQAGHHDHPADIARPQPGPAIRAVPARRAADRPGTGRRPRGERRDRPVAAQVGITPPDLPADQEAAATDAEAAARASLEDAAGRARRRPAAGQTRLSRARAPYQAALPAPSAPPARIGTPEPPEGTIPLAAHAPWGGTPRPERLVYADGTR